MISYLKTVTTVPHLTSLPTLLKLNTTARIWKRMVASKKFVLAKHFDGPPKESDLQLVEEELPPIKDGGNIYHFYISDSNSQIKNRIPGESHLS